MFLRADVSVTVTQGSWQIRQIGTAIYLRMTTARDGRGPTSAGLWAPVSRSRSPACQP